MNTCDVNPFLIVMSMMLGAILFEWAVSIVSAVRRRQKFARLTRLSLPSSDAIDELLKGPIKDYVWELHKECVRARASLETLPPRAAAESEKSINNYWSASIDKLMSISSFATEGALLEHGLTQEHPCQVMPPEASGS